MDGNTSPLVSVVINNYNNARYLQDCIFALQSQIYKKIEIIIVDAGSTDDSRGLIASLAKNDIRIKPIYSKKYIKFPAISYNIGFMAASGEYIAINDPDDISLEDRIGNQVDFLINHPDIDVVGSSVIEFGATPERIVFSSVSENVKRSIPPARNPTLMFRRDLISTHGLWRWKCEYAADFEWLYRWYCGGVKFFIIEKPLLKYRYAHGNNISNRYVLQQAEKILKFRIFFGVKLFFSDGIFWGRQICFSIIYCLSLRLKKIIGIKSWHLGKFF
jgi:glycosyltransferase involved in cell wall biosynthesis